MPAVLERGVPGVNAPDPTSFEEFWPFYVSQHLHPNTRRAHVAGMTLGWAAVVAAVLAGRPWLALGLPVLGYGGAIPSHYVWEGNRPASFLGVRPFLWSIRGDLRQTARFWTRRLDADVEAVRQALDR